MPLPVVPRRRAYRDIDRAVAELLSEADAHVATRFIDALERAMSHVAEFPSSGSPRFAVSLQMPGLRTWRVMPFPYLLVYFERPGAVDLWAVLHERRDIPVSLDDEMAAN